MIENSKICKFVSRASLTKNKVVNFGIILFWTLSFVILTSGTFVIIKAM